MPALGVGVMDLLRWDRNMQYYDILMLSVVLGATVWGAWKGLAWQIASLASMVVSYYVALRFRDPVAGLIDATPPWNMFLAMLVLFMATSLVIWIAFRFVSGLIQRVQLKEFDRQFGAIIGFAKGVLLCVIVTLFAVTLLGEKERQMIIDSRSGYYIAIILDRSHVAIPEEVHDVLGPYLHSLDERLGDDQLYGHDGDIPARIPAGNEP